MQGLKINGSIILLFSALLFALAGSLAFFPMQVQGDYTCLYHRLFQGESPVTQVCDKGFNENKAACARQSADKTLQQSALLHYYLGKYAVFWWASLALLFLFLYRIKKRKY